MRTIIYSILILLPLSGRVDAAQPTWPAEVRGFGLTIEGAKKHGLKVALDRFTEYLQALDPPIKEWQPTEEFVEKHLLSGAGSAGPDVEIGENQKGKSWIYLLKTPDKEQLTQANRRALGVRRLAERQAVSGERMILAGWMFFGFVSLLAMTMVYLRLNSASLPRKREE
jgi:hypothetical protein